MKRRKKKKMKDLLKRLKEHNNISILNKFYQMFSLLISRMKRNMIKLLLISIRKIMADCGKHFFTHIKIRGMFLSQINNLMKSKIKIQDYTYQKF